MKSKPLPHDPPQSVFALRRVSFLRSAAGRGRPPQALPAALYLLLSRLYGSADRALYQAKHRGEGQFFLARLESRQK